MNGAKLLVDTNVIIKHLSGDENCELILQGALLFISSITYAELLAGKITAEEEATLSQYLAGIHIIHTNDFICRTAGALRRVHKIKLPDALIAATAIFLPLPVVTFDDDFTSIDSIQIIKLTV